MYIYIYICVYSFAPRVIDSLSQSSQSGGSFLIEGAARRETRLWGPDQTVATCLLSSCLLLLLSLLVLVSIISYLCLNVVYKLID